MPCHGLGGRSVAGMLPRRSGFDPRSFHVRCVVDTHWNRDFSEHIYFSLSVSFHVIPYSSTRTCCCQIKWAEPGNLPASGALQEIKGCWIEENFHWLFYKGKLHFNRIPVRSYAVWVVRPCSVIENYPRSEEYDAYICRYV